MVYNHIANTDKGGSMEGAAVVPLIPARGEDGTTYAERRLGMAASQLVSYCQAVQASTSGKRAVFTAQDGDEYVICDAGGTPVPILGGGDRSELWLTGPDVDTATEIADCFRKHLATINKRPLRD